MNEIETVLRIRLQSLAEDMTDATAAAHAGYADSARARFRRRRRTRAGLALAAAAIVAALVSVPVIGESSSPDQGGDAVHPTTTTGATPSDTVSADSSQQRAEQAATAARLHSLAEDLRTALMARSTPLSLGGPAAAASCPERAPTVNSAFGATPAEHSSGAAAGDCIWHTPDGDLQVALGFMAGGTIEQIHADVDRETTRAGCLPTALPGSVTFAAVALCPEVGATGWHFRIMDTTGTGFWVLSVTVGDERPQDPAATVVAVLEAADADL